MLYELGFFFSFLFCFVLFCLCVVYHQFDEFCHLLIFNLSETFLQLKLTSTLGSFQPNLGNWGHPMSWILSGLEIRILEPGAISLKIARKLLLVRIFVHKFNWEPGAFHHPAGANLLFCSCYFKAWILFFFVVLVDIYEKWKTCKF